MMTVSPESPRGAPLLQVAGLQAWYGPTQALFDVSLDVGEGETLALLGTNGAGKSSTLRAICGLITSKGGVCLRGEDISQTPAHIRYRRHRIALVHEGRGLLYGLTVSENLSLGRIDRARGGMSSEVEELFPALAGRGNEDVANLSGGEQQMVAIARGLLADPSVLLLDEPSLGLAPSLVDRVYETLQSLKQRGRAMLLVEQNISRALEVADRVCVLRAGTVVYQRDVQKDPELISRLADDVAEAAFGVSAR